jgi:hypothetical protein
MGTKNKPNIFNKCIFFNLPFAERKDLTSTLPLLEMFHPTNERTVLQGVAAMFGPRLAGNFQVKPYTIPDPILRLLEPILRP